MTHAIDLMPDARSVRFEGFGHSIHLEDPPGMLDAVNAFLEALAG